MNEKTEVREVKSLAQRHAVINLRSQGLTPRLKAGSLMDWVSQERIWNVIPWFLKCDLFFSTGTCQNKPCPQTIPATETRTEAWTCFDTHIHFFIYFVIIHRFSLVFIEPDSTFGPRDRKKKDSSKINDS